MKLAGLAHDTPGFGIQADRITVTRTKPTKIEKTCLSSSSLAGIMVTRNRRTNNLNEALF